MKNIQAHQVLKSFKQEPRDVLAPSHLEELYSEKNIFKIEAIFLTLLAVSIFAILFICVALDRLLS